MPDPNTSPAVQAVPTWPSERLAQSYARARQDYATFGRLAHEMVTERLDGYDLPPRLEATAASLRRSVLGILTSARDFWAVGNSAGADGRHDDAIRAFKKAAELARQAASLSHRFLEAARTLDPPMLDRLRRALEAAAAAPGAFIRGMSNTALLMLLVGGFLLLRK